jgi:hypothetical protein
MRGTTALRAYAAHLGPGDGEEVIRITAQHITAQHSTSRQKEEYKIQKWIGWRLMGKCSGREGVVEGEEGEEVH